MNACQHIKILKNSDVRISVYRGVNITCRGVLDAWPLIHYISKQHSSLHLWRCGFVPMAYVHGWSRLHVMDFVCRFNHVRRTCRNKEVHCFTNVTSYRYLSRATNAWRCWFGYVCLLCCKFSRSCENLVHISPVIFEIFDEDYTHLSFRNSTLNGLTQDVLAYNCKTTADIGIIFSTRIGKDNDIQPVRGQGWRCHRGRATCD